MNTKDTNLIELERLLKEYNGLTWGKNHANMKRYYADQIIKIIKRLQEK